MHLNDTAGIVGPLEALIAAMFPMSAEGRLLGHAPYLHVVRTAEHVICRTHADLPRTVHDTLVAICQASRGKPGTWGRQHAACVNVLAEVAGIASIRSGPLFTVPVDGFVGDLAVPLVAANAGLLEPDLCEWLPDVSDVRPMMVNVEDGHAVAICTSVHASAEAHCARVETVPGYRRRGHAQAAVRAWAAAVHGCGAEPFYATTFDNVASQTLAHGLAMPLIGSEFSVHCRQT